jgi:hypothetical protein
MVNCERENTVRRSFFRSLSKWHILVIWCRAHDQVCEPDASSASEALSLSDWPSITAWLDITQNVDGLLVCQDLDQAIVFVDSLRSRPTPTLQAVQTQLLAHPANCSC